MSARDGFTEFLLEQFAPLGPVAPRRMFGKTGLFCDGLLFALIGEDALYFRVDDGNRAAFHDAATTPPLRYMKGGKTIDLAYWRAPDRLFDDQDELLAWARLALAAARRVAARRRVRA